MNALLWIVMISISSVLVWTGLRPFGRRFPRQTREVQFDKIAHSQPRMRIVKGLPALCVAAVVGAVTTTATLSGCAAAKPQLVPRVWTAPQIDQPTVDGELDSMITDGHGSHATQIVAAEFRFTHPRIQQHVTRFESGGCNSLRTALVRSRIYVPRMAAILRQAGLPPELVYLPLIESGFRPHAVSRAGAVGSWQLLAGTGRRYGLRIDRYRDERRDPLKSTQAAARYLADLHDLFGDWHLALAAYNAGEHTIARLLAAHQGATFWELTEQRHLNAETADFVPKFLAALQIAQRAEANAFDTASEASLL